MAMPIFLRFAAMLAATLVAAVLVVLGAPAQAEVQMVEPATDPERMLASLLE